MMILMCPTSLRKIVPVFFLSAHRVSSLSVQQRHHTSQRSLNVYFDSTNNLHRDIRYHPECPERISVCVNALNAYIAQNANVGKSISLQDVAQDQAFFSDDELIHARSMLVKAHSENYVEQIERKCRDSKARRLEEGKDTLGFIGYVDTGDTFMTTETYDVCLRATAAWIRAVDDAISSGDKAAVGFALTRPPGHHATRSLSNGFCHFNFAAAATFHAIEKGKIVSVLDWDVHYGQGVADILQNEPKARYVSLHQYPAFPYEGERRRTSGNLNNIMTIPVAADSTWTCGYKELFETHVLPFLISDNDTDDTNWKPDLILVCAGYDALADDELASVNLEPGDYGKMLALLKKWISVTYARGSEPGLAFGMEGGYRLQNEGERGLSAAFIETIKALF
mmetsp:Transcript_24987/g.38647  ORF Transcript_24987/g.38647 Transcript_24987/m.38647 type:complete len:395 (+) Transcript_24987:184-1368(+)